MCFCGALVTSLGPAAEAEAALGANDDASKTDIYERNSDESEANADDADNGETEEHRRKKRSRTDSGPEGARPRGAME